MRIYVASSWRNKLQQGIVAKLREEGHAVYDFMNPPNASGFAWSAIDKDWQHWDAQEYLTHLHTNPIASHGFLSDLRAMQWAEACVMVLPCGKSAHMEAGWFTGQGKLTIILLEGEGKVEPELMYLQAHAICTDMESVLKVLQSNMLFGEKP